MHILELRWLAERQSSDRTDIVEAERGSSEYSLSLTKKQSLTNKLWVRTAAGKTASLKRASSLGSVDAVVGTGPVAGESTRQVTSQLYSVGCRGSSNSLQDRREQSMDASSAAGDKKAIGGGVIREGGSRQVVARDWSLSLLLGAWGDRVASKAALVPSS